MLKKLPIILISILMTYIVIYVPVSIYYLDFNPVKWGDFPRAIVAFLMVAFIYLVPMVLVEEFRSKKK